MIIKKVGYILDVDVEGTVDYYRTNTLCECVDCRNFYSQAKERYPLLSKFLSELGVDISRPDELVAIEETDIIDYHFVAYTVVGKIVRYDEYEIDLVDDEKFLSIVIDNAYVPNEQKTEEYFTVTIYGIQLPNKLSEHEE